MRSRTLRFTECRPGYAPWRFGSRWRATIGELIVMQRAFSCLFLLLSACSAGAADDASLWKLYVRALENQSTAPNYVLITLVGSRATTNRVICTEAPFLLGAIHHENNLECDPAGQAKAIALVLKQKNRTFKFSNVDAIKNVQPRYTETELAEMRAAIKGYSDDDLRRGLTPEDTELQRKLFKRSTEGRYGAYRDAVAHLLLERGLLPRRGCIAGWITVDN